MAAKPLITNRLVIIIPGDSNSLLSLVTFVNCTKFSKFFWFHSVLHNIGRANSLTFEEWFSGTLHANVPIKPSGGHLRFIFLLHCIFGCPALEHVLKHFRYDFLISPYSIYGYMDPYRPVFRSNSACSCAKLIEGVIHYISY